MTIKQLILELCSILLYAIKFKMNFQELVKGCIKNDRLCQKELYNQFYSYGLKTVMAYGNSIEDSRDSQ